MRAQTSLPVQWRSADGGNDHWYQRVDTLVTWDQAKPAAEGLIWLGTTGHLATVASEAENTFLINTFLQGAPGANGSYAYLLGGYQPPDSPEPAGNWSWVTGEPWGYTHWYAVEPSNGTWSGSTPEDGLCISSYTNYSLGWWNDINRGYTYAGYIVEYEPSAVQWRSADGGNDHWYQRVDLLVNWDQAKAAAEGMSWAGVLGHLVTVTSEAENTFLVSKLLQGAPGANGSYAYLLGGFQPPNSPEPSGNWTWVTGEPWEYNHWYPVEPSNGTWSGSTPEDGLCVSSYTNYSLGWWNDINRGYTYAGWIVEYEPASLVIFSQPRSVTVFAHEDAVFSVGAAGTAPLAYQWSFNGANIPGATTSSLVVSNVMPGTLGSYTVVVSNSYKVVPSAPATLNMYPCLAARFAGLVTYWGQDVTLNVEAWGSAPLSYQWFFNGNPLPNATAPALSIPAIQFANAGMYSVVVTNAFGNVTNPPQQVVVNPAEVSLGLFPGMTIRGTVGYRYLVQSTIDLGNPNSWLNRTNITLTQPVQLWVDTDADASLPTHPKRFYRVLPAQ